MKSVSYFLCIILIFSAMSVNSQDEGMPVCLDCHGADEIEGTEMPSQPDASHEQCSACHSGIGAGPEKQDCSQCHVQ